MDWFVYVKDHLHKTFFMRMKTSIFNLLLVAHGSHQSWKVLKFEKSPGKSWNFFVVKQSKRDF